MIVVPPRATKSTDGPGPNATSPTAPGRHYEPASPSRAPAGGNVRKLEIGGLLAVALARCEPGFCGAEVAAAEAEAAVPIRALPLDDLGDDLVERRVVTRSDPVQRHQLGKEGVAVDLRPQQRHEPLVVPQHVAHPRRTRATRRRTATPRRRPPSRIRSLPRSARASPRSSGCPRDRPTGPCHSRQAQRRAAGRTRRRGAVGDERVRPLRLRARHR